MHLRVQPDKMAKMVATCIWEDWIFLFDMLVQIYIDQGLEFCNMVLKQFCNAMGINRFMMTPYHPQPNTQVEVFNKTMNVYLRKTFPQASESMVDWQQYIRPLIFSHNMMVHKATLCTPFYIMFNYDPRASLWPNGDIFPEDDDVNDNQVDP
jgi:transposase InsO family protein